MGQWILLSDILIRGRLVQYGYPTHDIHVMQAHACGVPYTDNQSYKCYYCILVPNWSQKMAWA